MATRHYTEKEKKENVQRAKLYVRTKKGLVYKMYSQQKDRCKRDGNKPPSYTRDELKDWLYGQWQFHDMYDLWVISGYDKWQIPSVDRDVESKGYKFGNITLMTWRENNNKSYEDKKSGKLNAEHKRVNQYTKDGMFIAEHVSIKAAARDTGTNRTGISAVISGKQKYANDFLWEKA